MTKNIPWLTPWLFSCAGSVVGIIAVGAYTRKTNSGLSMVDWKIFHFSSPKNEIEWKQYYDKYMMFPEFIQLIYIIFFRNADIITLNQFKKIYFIEHFHRVFGRILGMLILIPSSYIIIRSIHPIFNKRLAAVSLLTITQV